MTSHNYRGWHVWYDHTDQVYRAIRYGVTMNHQSGEGLHAMIDARVAEQMAGRSFV